MKKKWIIGYLFFILFSFLKINNLNAAVVTLSSNATIIGGNIIVNWSGFTGNVNVKFYKGSTFICYASANVGSSGSQQLTMTNAAIGNTFNLVVGTDYFIKVELKSNTSIYQNSSYFSISNPVVNISPSVVQYGNATTGTWSGFADNVNIKFCKGNNFICHVHTNWSGNSSEILTMTNAAINTGYQLTTGNDYNIVVELVANTNINMKSNYFTVNCSSQLPDIPNNLSINSVTNLAINLSWSSANNAISYDVFYCNRL